MNRRNLLGASALAATGAVLAGCGLFTTSTTNGVTTLTVNVDTIDKIAHAIENAVLLVASLPGIVGTPVAATIAAVGSLVISAVDQFDSASGGSLSVSIDTTGVLPAIQSLIADAQKLLGYLQTSIGNLVGAALQTAQTYAAALATLVSTLQAAIGLATTTPPAAAKLLDMSTALATFGVH